MEKDYSISISGSNTVSETWTCTNQLRWKQVEHNMENGIALNINELQQMWQGSNGEQKWEPVPFVE